MGRCGGYASSGRLYSWGDNRYGQLGVGDMRFRDTPAEIPCFKDKRVTSFSCGGYHTAAVTGAQMGFSMSKSVSLKKLTDSVRYESFTEATDAY